MNKDENEKKEAWQKARAANKALLRETIDARRKAAAAKHEAARAAARVKEKEEPKGKEPKA